MKIWVDADACPVAIRSILFKAVQRTGVPMAFVANQVIPIPPSANVEMIQVPSGLDAADNEIVKQMAAEDLVITADIPLAAEVIEKGGLALNPRGELYTEDDIRSRLSLRDFMDTLRSGGVETGGPPPFSPRDKQAFANQLDKWLTRRLRDS